MKTILFISVFFLLFSMSCARQSPDDVEFASEPAIEKLRTLSAADFPELPTEVALGGQITFQ